MPSVGVNIAILQDGAILLTQRDDFEVWCLPGGDVEAGETLAQAAVREAREETGLEVRLTRLVGVYSRPGFSRFNGIVVVFAGHAVGGELRIQPGETIDLRFFEPHNLPEEIVPLAPRRIQDAINGSGGSVAWFQNHSWPFGPGQARKQIYALRDHSGLPRAEFYRQTLGRPNPEGDLREVPPLNLPPAALQGHFRKDGYLSPEQRSGPPEFAGNVALIQDGKILLTRREDFDVWCLPGGGCEPGESLTRTAEREMAEETGLEVRLQRLVGIYSEPLWFQRGMHVAVFMTSLASGSLHLQAEEVVEARFFALAELPENLLYGHRQRVVDAFAGVGGSAAWTQNIPWPFDPSMSRQEIYALRDRSGLSPAAFYRQHFGVAQPEKEFQEVGEAV
jgi:ADP-ribose pyrophosphatase YjhB (NUDIX family)